MKAQSVLVMHAIMVGITISLVMVVIITFNGMKSDYQNFIATSSLEQTCSVIRSAIEKIYAQGEYVSKTDTTYGKLDLSLPEKMADLEYRTHFVNRTLFVTTAKPGLNATCSIGFDAVYSGSTSGGTTEIVFMQFANSTRKISVNKVG